MEIHKPLMLYDGDCGFCRRWIARWEKLTGNSVDYRPYQDWASRFPQVPAARFAESVHLFEPGGRVTHGAQAVFRSLAQNPRLAWLPAAYGRVPGLAGLSEALYAWVARHRSFLSRGASCGLSPADEKADFRISRWVFLKALALANFFAFLSLESQAPALVGVKGMEPLVGYLQKLPFHAGDLLAAPTLLWAWPADAALRALCGAGMFFSAALFAGWLPFASLAALWTAYLSLVTVGGDFLGFQWDNLLLECDLLALFLVPWGFWTGRREPGPVPGLAVFACRWLLVRLRWGAGWVKLASGDPTWRRLTALIYHYQTQPLPTPLAWWMARLPAAFQEVSCFFVLAVELGAPLLLFGPRRWRAWAFPPLALLQVLIALTGNYCFFNLLALGLCFFTLEDAAWPARARAWFSPRAGRGRYPPGWARALVLGPVLLVSAALFAGELGVRGPGRVLAPLEELAAPFRSVNTYGLFAVMTTVRREITVEGSDDGRHWKAYGFKDKPGDLSRAPGWVAPLQPRLDWQMWFAALGPAGQSPWFKAFLVRLLQGSPQVTALLGRNPFPDAPPRSIRAVIAEYRFTDAAERARTGDWWKAGAPQLYVPAFRLPGVK